IFEPDVERDGGDRIAARREPLRRRAQPGTQQPLVRRDTGHVAEGAKEVVGAQTRDPRELRERVALVEPGLEPAQYAGDAPAMRAGGAGGVTRAPVEPADHGGAELEGDLFERVLPCHRRRSPRAERRQGAMRRNTIALEHTARRARVVRQPLEERRLELERQAAVAFAMLVRALERHA